MEEVKHINEEEIEILLQAAEELGSKVLSWLEETIVRGDFSGEFYTMKNIDKRCISLHYELNYHYDHTKWARFYYKYEIEGINFNSKEAIANKTKKIKSEEYFRKAKQNAIGFLLKKLARTQLECYDD